MNATQVKEALARESAGLNAMLRGHARLRDILSPPPPEERTQKHYYDALATYLEMLRLSYDYVQHTVPALHAAGDNLISGSDEDRRWGDLLLGYAAGETDEDAGYGHQHWAHEDMVALGASPELLSRAPHPAAEEYGRYLVAEVGDHPYAVLGAKAVLEGLSVLVADDIAAGIVELVPEAVEATRFFAHHGVLDIEHVREGSESLGTLWDPGRLHQVLAGGYMTATMYRTLVGDALGWDGMASSEDL